MSIMNEAAHLVENAWCKGDLIREGVSREEGNTYCAVGALAMVVVSHEDGLDLSLYGDKVGPAGPVQRYKDLAFKYWSLRDGKSASEYDANYAERVELLAEMGRLNTGWLDTYEFMDDKIEVKALAHTIVRIHGDRIGLSEGGASDRLIESEPTTVIVRFNDHEDTTREDVINVMRLTDEELENNA